MALFQFLPVAAAFFLHPYYVSMTDINFNSKNKTLEVSVRLLTDDFEKTLRKNCNCKVDLASAEQKQQMEKLAVSYISKHLEISIGKKRLDLKFDGYKQEEENTWLFFEADNIVSVKSIEIINTLLHDYTTQQSNMLHIAANGKEADDKLDYPNSHYNTSY